MGVGSQRHALAALRPGKRPSTNRTRGCVVPRGGLDGWGKSRPTPSGIRSPDRSACSVSITYFNIPECNFVKFQASER